MGLLFVGEGVLLRGDLGAVLIVIGVLCVILGAATGRWIV